MLGELLTVQLAVVPDQGEDSFAASNSPEHTFMCVADGCGGLGSKRYDQLDQQTGAYLASQLATRTTLGWWQEKPQFPTSPTAGQALLEDLQQELNAAFSSFAAAHCQATPTRIVGSMQRTLPTTLCALMMAQQAKAAAFIWAGDSRGYTMDLKGLHQYTKDDVRGNPDAFESLLLDRPLSNLICADQPPVLHMCRFSLPDCGLVLCATDGVYNTFSSPMELETMLLDTMMHSAGWQRWRRKMERTFSGMIQDDTTLLCYPYGFETYHEMKRYFLPRYEQLKREYITPVHRKRRNRDAARAYWQEYRTAYDRTEGTADGEQDWRI